jgi:hypothetical protein
MQLADDGRDLLGEVARVHGDWGGPASGVVYCADTERASCEKVFGLEHVHQCASGKWRQLARNARVAVLAAVRPRVNESNAQ